MEKITGCENCPFCEIVRRGIHEVRMDAECFHPKYTKVHQGEEWDDYEEWFSGKTIEPDVDKSPQTPKFCPFKKYF